MTLRQPTTHQHEKKNKITSTRIQTWCFASEKKRSPSEGSPPLSKARICRCVPTAQGPQLLGESTEKAGIQFRNFQYSFSASKSVDTRQRSTATLAASKAVFTSKLAPKDVLYPNRPDCRSTHPSSCHSHFLDLQLANVSIQTNPFHRDACPLRPSCTIWRTAQARRQAFLSTRRSVETASISMAGFTSLSCGKTNPSPSPVSHDRPLCPTSTHFFVLIFRRPTQAITG